MKHETRTKPSDQYSNQEIGWKSTVPMNRGIVERDGMPREVAESMLFTPGVKLTSAMRRACMAARETVYQSTLEPKDFKIKLAARAKKASAAQLAKWASRTYVKRQQVTRDYMRLKGKLAAVDPMKLHEIAKAERVLAIMDIEAQRLDAEMNAYRIEASNRLRK